MQGIITTSREYRGESRYRRLDLLDALGHLMESGSGMGIEQAGMCAGCRQVLHNALDEREMQRLVRLDNEKQEHIVAMKVQKEQEAAAIAASVSDCARFQRPCSRVWSHDHVLRGYGMSYLVSAYYSLRRQRLLKRRRSVRLRQRLLLGQFVNES